MNDNQLSEPFDKLFSRIPWISDFFVSFELQVNEASMGNFKTLVDSLDDEWFADKGSTRSSLIEQFLLYISQMSSIYQAPHESITSITIEAGKDKSGNCEKLSVTLKSGEVTAIVGPTGSGKSRLLGDIESLAQCDTPTGRRVLINGLPASAQQRYTPEKPLIAQLSQNMNFVMDLSVEEFLVLHAQSRMCDAIGSITQKIFETANSLAGERFAISTAITQLSGGQSRALMIADTALLSAAPIVLIDEIENAGIDRVRALNLLISSNKIILIATHDPLLALSAHRRIIIKNGGIEKVITTSENEKVVLEEFRRIDTIAMDARATLRRGGVLDTACF